MPGDNQGRTSGAGVPERPAGKDGVRRMEFEPLLSTCADTYPRDSLRKMYRDVLFLAMRDAGSCVDRDAYSVARWIRLDSFEYCCDIAELDSGWCREIILAILMLPASTRREITSVCLRMLDVAEPAISNEDALRRQNEPSKGDRRLEKFQSMDIQPDTSAFWKLYDIPAIGSDSAQHPFKARTSSQVRNRNSNPGRSTK